MDRLVPITDTAYNRGKMGDGVIEPPLIRSCMETNGHHGFHELQIASARNEWKRGPDEVAIIRNARRDSVC